MELEDTRLANELGSRGPLKTILSLCPGPLFSQISAALYGLVNTLWLSHIEGELATTAISAAMAIDYTGIAFGISLNTAACSKLASLFGEKRNGEASKILSDLLRLTFIIGLIAPAIFLPLAKPLMRWFGSHEDVVDLGFQYLLVVLSGSFFTCLYLFLCGCLQAEGRSGLYSIVQVLSALLNAVVFNPLFLLEFKMGIKGTALSTLLSEAIPGIGLLICYYCGMFDVKPKLKELKGGFSKEFVDAVKVGSSSLLSGLSGSLPMVFFQKFIGMTTSNPDDFNVHMSMYNAYIRIFQIFVAVYISISQALLPAASYSYSAGLFKRVRDLILHSYWLITVCAFVMTCVLYFFRKEIATVFTKDEDFVHLFDICLFPYWAGTTFFSWLYIGTSILQATRRPLAAFWCTLITEIVLFPAVVGFLYLQSPHDPKPLYWSGSLNDVICIFILLPFVISPFRELFKKTREENLLDSHMSETPFT